MTTTFVCDTCGTIDDITATPQDEPGWRCSYCKTGHWHGFFAQEQWSQDNPEPMLNRALSTTHPDL